VNGEVKGLNEFFGKHPPVAPVFWAFRLMVGTGILMLLISWGGAIWLRLKGMTKPLSLALIVMTFSGWLATVSGWYVTEVGRQPWLVTGVLKTADAASNVPAPMIGMSLSMYLIVYVVLMIAFMSTIFYMARKAINPDYIVKGGIA
jgi:cytochrome d ubiquinol oxidase subunit I